MTRSGVRSPSAPPTADNWYLAPRNQGLREIDLDAFAHVFCPHPLSASRPHRSWPHCLPDILTLGPAASDGLVKISATQPFDIQDFTNLRQRLAINCCAVQMSRVNHLLIGIPMSYAAAAFSFILTSISLAFLQGYLQGRFHVFRLAREQPFRTLSALIRIGLSVWAAIVAFQWSAELQDDWAQQMRWEERRQAEVALWQGIDREWVIYMHDMHGPLARLYDKSAPQFQMAIECIDGKRRLFFTMNGDRLTPPAPGEWERPGVSNQEAGLFDADLSYRGGETSLPVPVSPYCGPE